MKLAISIYCATAILYFNFILVCYVYTQLHVAERYCARERVMLRGVILQCI